MKMNFFGNENPAFLSIWERMMGSPIDGCCVQPLKEKEIMDVDAYLKKGERILSLVRKRDTRFKNESMKDLLEYINCVTLMNKSGEWSKMEYLSKRINAAIRSACERIIQDEANQKAMEREEQLDYREILSLVPDFLGKDVKMEDVYYGYGAEMLSAVLRKELSETHVVHVVVGKHIDGYMSLTDQLPKKKHGRRYRYRGERNGKGVVLYDAAMLFSRLVKIGIICEYVKQIEEPNTPEDTICCMLQKMYRNSERNAMSDTGILLLDSEVGQNEWYMHFLYETSIAYSIMDSGPRMRKRDLIALQILEKQPIDCDTAIEHNYMFDDILLSVLEAYVQEKRTEDYLKGTKERAKVFMTKKQINKATVEAMMKSSFNNTFSYVEFDDDVNLELMSEIEKEFEALNSIMRIEKSEDSALRFRKLGNYKASGLYFPSLNCLCVDIRTPSSMAHELFHMIDFTKGQLSRNASFDRVETMYKMLVDKAVDALPKGDAIRKQWVGKTKFNRNYYFEPTEIFARCGEIYLARICKVHNSLCVPDEELSIVYPESDELNALIEEYYDRLLGREEQPEKVQNYM